jgi:hypothetical protein
VATRVFADEELARLREFPEIGREELFRFFTLSPSDLAFVDPGRGRGRGPADRLRYRDRAVYVAVVGVRARSCGHRPAGRGSAAGRATEDRRDRDPLLRPPRHQTRTDHLRLVAQYLG